MWGFCVDWLVVWRCCCEKVTGCKQGLESGEGRGGCETNLLLGTNNEADSSILLPYLVVLPAAIRQRLSGEKFMCLPRMVLAIVYIMRAVIVLKEIPRSFPLH